ncbi:hypothetical protein [Nannocystis pusilla]|uniref:hypothetical protein n=1 Tax=Nannocystis pusilla TaxID=889268 RepID=UPI003B76E919
MISAETFDGTTPLDPTLLNPKTANGGSFMPVPTQNEPRTQVTIEGPVGRFNIASLLRSGNNPALIRVRAITDPDGGTWGFRSASATEQPESVGPLGIDQLLAPVFDLTQQWGPVHQAGPTDAVFVNMIRPGGGSGQIEIEVAELNGDLAALGSPNSQVGSRAGRTARPRSGR